MITEIIIFGMLVSLTTGMALTYIHADNILDATNNRINNLEKDVAELNYQVEELEEEKPKEKYNVKVEYFFEGEEKTKNIYNVVEITDNTYWGGYEYKEADKLIFVKENGKFVLKITDLISYEKTLVE